MRPRVIMVLALAAILIGGGLLVPAAFARLRANVSAAGSGGNGGGKAASPTPPPPPPPPTLKAQPVSVKVDGFVSWALLDRKTGEINGSTNITATNSTESMIKVWIVSDFLRRTAAAGKRPTATQLKWATTAILDSNDHSAESLFNLGGRAPVITRLIKTCGLTDTKSVIPPGSKTVWWSYTRISARDAVRMGECVKNGTAAGPDWTDWVLTQMSKVRGTVAAKDQHDADGWGGGRWGIIDGLPPEILKQGVSIKNGWTPINADGRWHVNCLAVSDDWVLAVLMRYPIKNGLTYGANACASVAEQLVYDPGAAANSQSPPAQG